MDNIGRGMDNIGQCTCIHFDSDYAVEPAINHRLTVRC